MAISVNGARFIAFAIRKGVSLGQLLTVGRLGLYAPKSYLNRLLAAEGFSTGFPLADGDAGFPASGEWADDLYRHFGATSVRVMDGSAYEGADLVHNLNQPLPASLTGRFDCLLDGGTLEHVFNVPEALASYMKLVKVGGHVLLLDMPATNACGHGFYQFSPGLFWQTFSQRYGFEIVDMLVVGAEPLSRFWRVGDPSKLNRRVELIDEGPCHLYVLARKVAEFPGFDSMPIQEDYAVAWIGESASGTRQTGIALGSALRRMATRYAPLTYWRFSSLRNYRRARKYAMLGGAGETGIFTAVDI